MTLQQRAINVKESLPEDKISQVIQFADFLSFDRKSQEKDSPREVVNDEGYIRKPGILNGSVPVWDASIFRFIRIIGRITGGRKDYMEQMDYALAAYHPVPIKTYEFDLKSNLGYGGSEGIYLDLWIDCNVDGEMKRFELGTYKTLW